jgi:hypothetical protein
MKALIVVLFFTLSSKVLADPSEVRNWKTVFGASVTAWLQCYTNDAVTLQKVGITYTYKFSTLSKVDQEYLKGKAGIIYSAPEEDIKIKEEIKRKQEQAQQELEKKKRSFYFKGNVVQIVNDGILFTGKYRSYEAEQDAEQKITKALELKKQAMSGAYSADQADALLKKGIEILKTVEPLVEDTYFIAGVPSGLVDNDEWSGYVYLAGQYQYVNLLGARRTVRAFATTEEKAFKMTLSSSQPELKQ